MLSTGYATRFEAAEDYIDSKDPAVRQAALTYVLDTLEQLPTLAARERIINTLPPNWIGVLDDVTAMLASPELPPAPIPAIMILRQFSAGSMAEIELLESVTQHPQATAKVRQFAQQVRDELRQRREPYPDDAPDLDGPQVGTHHDEGVIDLLDFTAELFIYTSTSCLIGKKFREDLDAHVAHLFHGLEQGTDAIAFVDPYADIESFHRRDAARAELVQIIEAIMARRREAGPPAPAARAPASRSGRRTR